MWKSGSASTRQSSRLQRHAIRSDSALASRFACERRRGVERGSVRVGERERGRERAQCGVDGAQRVGARRVVADRRARARIADQVRELGRGIGGVRGHDHEPEPQARDVRHDQIERGRRRDQHAITGAQARGVQPPSGSPRRGVERPVAEIGAAPVGEHRAIGRVCEVARPAARQRARAARGRIERCAVGQMGGRRGHQRSSATPK
jgi:hypothetical protein